MKRLTAAQSAMLFDQIAAPATVGNNVVASMIVTSEASVSMHRQAWLDALHRHPVLTSRIIGHDDGFRFDTAEGNVSVDVTAVTDVGDRHVRAELARVVTQPFDLFAGPLVRAAVRTDGRRSVVALVAHHVLIDVASAPMILNEYFAHLRRAEHGELGGLITPGADFDEFVDAEQHYLLSADADVDRSYWRKLLAGHSRDPLAGLPVSNDPGLDPLEPYVRFETDPGAAAALRSHARAAGVSPASVFLAAYLRALAAVGGDGHGDLAVGLPVLHRDERHSTTLGSFTQLAVVRAEVGGRFDEDILRAGGALAGAKRHGRLPLSEIAKFSDDPSSLTRTTFLYEPSHLGFGTAFVLGDDWELDMSGYTGTPYPVPSQTGQFDLRFQAGLVHGRYVCAVHFGPHMRVAATLVAENICENLRNLAHTGTVDFVAPGVGGSGWTHPASRSATPGMQRADDVVARIGEVARDRPGDAAVSTETSSTSYGELWCSAGALARTLRGRRGELIAVVMPKNADAIAAVVGIMLSGNSFVVVDPSYPPARRSLMLEGVAGVVVHPTTVAAVPESFRGLVVEHSAASGEVGAPVPDAAPPLRAAYAVYTSGSTGRPKRVLVGRDELARSTAARDTVYSAEPQRFLHLSSLSFDSAYAGLFWTLARGGELVLIDMGQPRSTSELAEVIETRAVTHLLAIPSLHDALLDEADRLRSLEQVIVAGEECTEALVRRHHTVLLGAALTNEYGPSESAVWSTADHTSIDGPVTIGRAIPGIGVRVVDETGQLVAPGTAGELHVSGTLAYGYDGDPRTTADKFRPDASSSDGGRVYATGDRVRVAADGRLLFDGRVDEQLKISGFRVEPREVEALVRRICDISCVAGAVAGPGGRRDLVVAVVEDTFAGLDVDALLARIRAEVPAHLAPRNIVSVREIPRNVNGKIDRRAVAEQLAATEPVTEFETAPTLGDERAPATAVVVDAVCHALSTTVDAARSFLDHGGDSIAAMRVVGYLHRRGLTLSPRDLLTPMPLSELDPAVDHRSVPTRAKSARLGDSRPTTRAQRAMLLQTSRAPSSGVYVEQLVLDLVGDVDAGRLAAAWRTVFTTFPILGARSSTPPYEVLETGRTEAVPIVVREDAVDWASELADDRSRGFSLDDDTLSRVLIAPGAAGIRVLWTHHHAVADGWSLPIVIGTLAAAYRGENTLQPQHGFAELPVADTVVHRSAASPLLDRLPHPAEADAVGAARTHTIEMLVDIDLLADRYGVTTAALINMVWSLALAQAFGTRTVEHGMVSSGRDIGTPGMESAVGMFVRIDPIAATWSSGTTIADLGAHVAGQVASAIDGPIATGWTPETLVVVENYPMDPSVLSFGDGIETAAVDLVEQTEFPLVLQYRQWPARVCHLHVDAARVPSVAADALANGVRSILETLATARADISVEALFSRPETDAPTVRTRPRPVVERIADHARLTPLRPALVHSGTTTTYAELDSSRGDLARGLHDAGVAPGHVVAIRATADAALAPLLLAVLTVGAAWILIDDDLPPRRADIMIARSGAHWTLDQGHEPVRTDSALPPAGAASLRAAMSFSDLAYLIFTSGTTGEPKAIAVSQDALAAHLDGICARFGYDSSDSVLVFGSVAFDASLEQLFGALVVGATAVSRPKDIVDPADLATFLSEHDVTVFNPPTGYWTQFFGRALPASIRTVVVGGEALPAWATTVDGEVTLWNAYGPTEAVVTALTHRVTSGDTDPLPIGSPQSGRGAVLLGPDLLPVADGVLGEIWLTGILATGYIGDARATADAFRPDPDAAGKRMYRTADLGVRRADGEIVFAGRADRQVKVRGYRVDPAEIESAAVAVDGVARARAVLIAPSAHVAARLECAVVTDGSGLDAHTVRAAMGRVLPAHLMPSRVHVVSELPLTRTGKVDDDALRTAVAAVNESEGDPGDAADVDGIVSAAMRDVLGDIDRSTGFVSAGGDSLRALELSAIVRRSGVVLDVQVALADGTIDQLVATATVDPSVVSDGSQPERSRLLPPAVHWFRERVSQTPVSTWNMAVRFELDGLPDSAVTDKAVRSVLDVHPMLRVRLDEKDAVREFVLSDTCPVVYFFDTNAAETERACTRVFNTLSTRVGMDNGTPIGFGFVRDMETGRTSVIVLAHHFVMDVVSLQIVAGDLLEALAHAADPHFSLPPERTSVHEWVQWLASDAGTAAALEAYRAAYRGLPERPAVSEHIDPGLEGEAGVTERAVSAATVFAATSALGATIEELLQSAAATAHTATTGVNPAVLEVETHGRELGADTIDLTRTVGWFTSLSAVPVHADSADAQIAEIRGRRRYLGSAGQLTGTLRYVLGADPSPVLHPEVGVNYVGRLDDERAGSMRAYGSGRLRASGTPRPVAVQIDAWLRGDEFVVSVEHVDAESAERTADAIVVALNDAGRARSVPVATGVCEVDLRGNTLDDILTAAGGNVEAVAPLTEVQEAMYLRSDSDADAAYVEQIVLALPEGTDAARLRDAVESAATSIPLLRGVITWEGLADPVLVVPASASVAEVVDRVDAKSEIRAVADGSALFRASITSSTLVLTFHHLVADGWTTRMLVQHIDDRYAGRPVPTRPDRRMLDHMVASDGRERFPSLDRSAAVLLPALNAPVASGTPGNTDLTRVVHPDRARDIRRAAARHGVTLASLAHAGWALLLADGIRRVRFGSIGQRRPTGHDDAPGMYIEARTLDLRVPAGVDISELLTATHRALQSEGSTSPEPGALVTVGTGAMYESAVIVDDVRGTGSAAKFLGRPVQVVSSRERTGLALTVSVLDRGIVDGVEVTLNCDTAHVSESDGHRILEDYIEILLTLAGEQPGDAGPADRTDVPTDPAVESSPRSNR